MSRAKELIEKQNDYRNCAKEILLKLNVIEQCPYCGYYTSNYFDLSKEIYAKATAIAEKDYNNLTDIKYFHTCLKEVFDESGVDKINYHLESEH